jgi:hypothetical protein
MELGDGSILDIHKTWALPLPALPRDSRFPLDPAINATYVPSIEIKVSSTVINLVMTFESGTFYARNLLGNMRSLDIARWVYVVTVNLDFEQIMQAR